MSKLIGILFITSFLLFPLCNFYAQNGPANKAAALMEKYKKKSPTMKFLTEKACDEFNALQVEKLDATSINTILLRVAIRYDEIIRPHYDTLTKKGLRKYIKKLTALLEKDCALVREYSQREW